ncbi:MAG TPA: 3-dehydroquinate synthase [Symbiobacteriaceae bacterium]|nr:3-dehydroquinate synthase [Symbiobacteriaceae bacterium]
MTEVFVQTPGGAYAIRVGSGLLATLGAEVKRVLPTVTKLLVLTDETVGALYGDAALASLRAAGLASALVAVPAGESSKSIAQLGQLWAACAEAGLDRSSCIIALGGGVVGDLAGFVAATYMRGIPFVQVPTTLLAGVDSSVGGKTGIDLPQGKNLVGAFHQPVLVLMDVALLRTLPPRELSAGLAEVVKHGIIRDPALLDWLEREAAAVLACQPERLAELLAWNCRIKAAVVGQDERESGLRAILNFGHTIGHALEAIVGGQAEAGAGDSARPGASAGAKGPVGAWVHGECVAVGTVGALVLSQAVGLLQETALRPRIEALLERLHLPTRFPAHVTAEAVLPFIARDKKATKGRPTWVLAQRAGEVLLSADVSDAEVLAALAYLKAQ